MSNQKGSIFQNDKKMNWLKWILMGLPWRHNLTGNNVGHQWNGSEEALSVWADHDTVSIKLKIFSPYENETSNVNYLIVKDNKVGTKNFTRLHVGVSIANKMGGKLGKLPMTGLYSIAVP